ncbi:DUF4093 domain-containing protein [Oscillospiraceae bacterium OttesenSCG-928-F05]|nr:DUF4093 domain-containing protein [Oscillospiraceae bacterium OttesenSCG-928-F05]
MKKVREAIIVEGRYDKNTLSQIVDTVILETSGFSVFSNKELVRLLRRIAAERGVIVLTDSDSAGFLIRNYLKGCLPPEMVKHAYIPDRMGKERRKAKPSKEGKLGVEGMRPEEILAALQRAGATFLEEADSAGATAAGFTGADFYAYGLAGTPGSAEKRKRLLKALDLPERLSGKALLGVLSALYTREELEAYLETCGQ